MLPYLYSINSTEKVKIRIFTLGEENKVAEDEKHLKNLLEKFRINVQKLTVLTDWKKAPSQDFSTQSLVYNLLRKFIEIIQKFFFSKIKREKPINLISSENKFSYSFNNF